MSRLAAVADEIEPDAVELYGDGATVVEALLASIAISARRLADAAERDRPGEGA